MYYAARQQANMFPQYNQPPLRKGRSNKTCVAIVATVESKRVVSKIADRWIAFLCGERRHTYQRREFREDTD